MRRADATRSQHLDAVADVFLAPDRSPVGETATLLLAAAPGTADTASVLETMRPGAGPDGVRNLGPAIGVRLGRLERTGEFAGGLPMAAQLIWCPTGAEGLSLTAALALGRLAALIRPTRTTVLWFAGGIARIGRDPSPLQQERARRLACAAYPAATVSLHCLGWQDDPMGQLADLAGRFH